MGPRAVVTSPERRPAEAQVRELIAKLAPAQDKVVAALRRRLRKRLPTAHEIVYEYASWIVISYSPSERGYEGVLGVRASATDVRLFLNRGKELPDPAKLLRGTGGLVRWVAIEGASTLARPEVKQLIEEAIARNPVPFARTGRGPLVVRAAAAKKRRARKD